MRWHGSMKNFKNSEAVSKWMWMWKVQGGKVSQFTVQVCLLEWGKCVDSDGLWEKAQTNWFLPDGRCAAPQMGNSSQCKGCEELHTHSVLLVWGGTKLRRSVQMLFSPTQSTSSSWVFECASRPAECPGSDPWSSPSWSWLEHLHIHTTFGCLSSLDCPLWWKSSCEGTTFHCLYLWSCYFIHHPELLTSGELERRSAGKLRALPYGSASFSPPPNPSRSWYMNSSSSSLPTTVYQ